MKATDWKYLGASVAAIAALICPGLLPAQQDNGQKQWERTLAEAKKEGTVVVTMSSMGSETRPKLHERLRGLPGR